MIFSVRKAEYGDIKKMSNILNEIINEGGLTLQNSITTPVDFKRDYFTNPFSLCNHVATQGTKIIGFQFLEWSDPNWSGIDKLPSDWGLIATYVSKNERGLGVGKQLFEATRLASNNKGMCSISATMNSTNKGAIGYYESLGFCEYFTFENEYKQTCISKRFDLRI